jgi:putative transposase
VPTGTGRVGPEVPRDRQATFDPRPIARYQRRFPGFDAKVAPTCARGMGTREIRGRRRELYGIEVSPDPASAVADAVPGETAAWQDRPLEPLHPSAPFGAIRAEVRDEGTARNEAVHVAPGVRPDGTEEIPGLRTGRSGGRSSGCG